MERRAQRAVATGRVIPFLAGATAGLALLSGFIATLVDPEDLATFGDGIWWALVTLATVGYGDIVPHTAWGRFLGSVVMIIGITFLSFLTATVTSYFVSAQEEVRDDEDRELPGRAEGGRGDPAPHRRAAHRDRGPARRAGRLTAS